MARRVSPSRGLLLALALALVTLSTSVGVGAAPTSGTASPSAAPSATTAPTVIADPPPPVPVSELARSLLERAAQVNALVRGELELSLDPKSLFDVDVEDERAIGIEAERLERLLEARDPGDAGVPIPAEPTASLEPATPPGTTTPDDTRAALGAAPPSTAAASTATPPPPAAPSWTRAELRARLRLDRARLAFYRLPSERRQSLFETHRERQAADREARAAVQVDEAKQRAADAERKQQEALEAARTARTEALRLVAEEHARLLGLSRQQAEQESAFVQARAALAGRQETVIGWQRRVGELIARVRRGDAEPDEVDALYHLLRRDLGAGRDALAAALNSVYAGSAVPDAGEDRLNELPDGVPADEPRQKRAEVSAEARRLRAMEAALRKDQVEAYFAEVVALNAQRLTLYPFLSPAARDAVSGFGPRGVEQAQAELRQVSLIARHQLTEVLLWLDALRKGGTARSQGALALSWVAMKWLVPIALFVWWRRRADAAIAEGRQSARDERRKRRVVSPEPVERLLNLVQRIRAPLEWLLLVAAIVWLLPLQVRQRIEVELATTVLYWTMGGALVIALINAWADRQQSGTRRSQLLTAHLRLRSLRLVGRSIVIVALVLNVSDQLVGKGTIYDWVQSTAWIAAVPILLLLARWWGPTVVERMSQRRRKSPFVQWVLRQTGWRALPAALVGGGYLMWEGTLRALRPRVSSFELSRRVLAYLFRRGMSQRADAVAQRQYQPLPKDLFRALGPSCPSLEVVPSVADDQVAAIIRRIDAAGGALFALVGERGAGKSTLLRRIASEGRDVKLVECPLDPDGLASALGPAAGLDAGAELADAARIMNGEGRDAGLLFDDAHRLIRPYRGGMAAFDRLIAVARAHSARCSWGFAFDEITWGFLERTRGARPLFDEVIALEPWNEEGIASLLGRRCREVDVQPDFSGLIRELPSDADEIDRQEALDATRIGYHRMIWDYSTGNPGIALHAFRRSLGRVGDAIEVKVFAPPDVRELEVLPDAAVFVLRAVLQLEYASAPEVTAATALPEEEVLDALRFGTAHGYLETRGNRYWITWAWFRPITRLLERRHLLTF